MATDRAPCQWRQRDRLAAGQLQSLLVGNTMTGRHRWLIRWAMYYRPDGTTGGQFTLLGRRTGRWWLDGDIWCAAWPMMNGGEPLRYVAFPDGHRLKWFKTTGEEMASNPVHPGNPYQL